LNVQTPTPKLILASASPRRRQLLSQLGYEFDVMQVDIVEQPLANEAADAYGRRITLAKVEAAYSQTERAQGDVILSADTEVILEGDIFGKPANASDAAAMLRRLSGRTHEVLSVVVAKSDQFSHCVLQTSKVRMRKISDDEIHVYLQCGEAIGKAGAYAIQGRAAAFIEHLEGSYTGVMGLPLFETAQLLAQFQVYPNP
jgi:septum formation protein